MNNIFIKDPSASFTGILVTGIDYWRAFKEENRGAKLAIEMPCGQRFEYDSAADAPDVDTPCPCGNPDHWVIRFER